MATVTTTIAMTGDYVPFERPPDSVTLWSAIPRGLQSFFTFASVDLKPINDRQVLTCTGTLPPNFAYVMDSLNFSLGNDRAFDWGDIMNLNLQNFYRAPVDESVALSGNWAQEWFDNTLNGQTKAIHGPTGWPTYPIIGSEGTSGVQIQISGFNQMDPATIAGVITCMISFWVFDLEQVRKFPINSPFPVHAR